MELNSSAFTNNQRIPKRFTCKGANINPPLSFSEISEEALQLALIMEDLDEQTRENFTHWLVYGISPSLSQISENFTSSLIVQGKNDFGEIKYSGPCPPSKTHRYAFTLFALSEEVDLNTGIDKEELLEEIEDQIIDQAQLIGLFNKRWV